MHAITPPPPGPQVYYSDGMYEDYEPNLFTKVFAFVTLGLYIGIPQIILALVTLSIWFTWARVTLALAIASAFMPLRPLKWPRVLGSYMFLTWRRYFKFSFVFDESLNAYKDYVTAQFPHGAFPMGSLLSGTFMATEYPEYNCYALAANNSFLVPVWRHVHTWLGTMAATERNFRRLLALGTRGVTIGVMVGGIAEMYLLHPEYEQIKLLDRKGFVRIAVEHGAELLPCYMFGVSQMMSFGPPWLMNVGRRLRMSIGVMYGQLGTPVPRRVPMRMAIGMPISVGPAMPRSDPRFEEHVERMHAAVVEGVRAVYYRHRGAYGWGNRPLVIV
ncbi:MAG: diacylglycerol acyltransferase-domain-containing protein [Monoraphidium minutum]|nr:MAG: diacylglycerol acyltransferase-domain-containing protein [Monoraphidium minutum]